MKLQSNSGQILVLVLLVVLVGLTVGLSIASRTLSTIKNTAELDQSNRAFSAAEAGVERALSSLKADPNACDDNQCKANIDGVESKVAVTTVGGNDHAFGISTLDKDQTMQAQLEGTNADGSKYYFTDTGRYIDFYWGNYGDAADCTGLAASVVISVIYENSGAYGMGKAALDPCIDAGRSPSNNFTRSGIQESTDTLTLQDGTTFGEYAFKYRLDLQPGGPLVASGSKAVLIRARLMYHGPKPVAFNPISANLPGQGQQITSTAVVGGKQRTVKVLKTTSALPAIFDYALFNGSTNSLSK